MRARGVRTWFLLNILVMLLVGCCYKYVNTTGHWLDQMEGATVIELSDTGSRLQENISSPGGCSFWQRQTLLPLDEEVSKSIIYGPFGQFVNSSMRNEVFDVGGGQTIIDLICTFKWPHAFYHRLIDCFVPAICTLHYAMVELPSAPVLVPQYLLEISKFFLNRTNSRILPYTHKGDKAYGLNITSNGSVDVIFPDLNATMLDRQRGLAAMRNFIQSRDQMTHQSPNHVTIIKRSCTRSRCFLDFDMIIDRFTRGMKMPIVVYYGNETFEDTVNIFANSRVIVGYHGAGLANAIFSPQGTVVLEYTTFHQMNATRMWRTNENVARVHGGLVWLKHGIDIDRLTDMETLQNKTDTDSFIKSLNHVVLTGAVIYNSIERIKQELSFAESNKEQT